MDGIPRPLSAIPLGILQDMAGDDAYQADPEYFASIQEEIRARGERVPDDDDEGDFLDDEPPRPRQPARPREPTVTELPCGHPVSDLSWNEGRDHTRCSSCVALEAATKYAAKKDAAVSKRIDRAFRGWRPPPKWEKPGR